MGDVSLHALACVEQDHGGDRRVIDGKRANGNRPLLIEHLKPGDVEARDKPAIPIRNACVDQHEFRVSAKLAERLANGKTCDEAEGCRMAQTHRSQL